MAAQVKALSIKRLAIIFYARGSSSDWESTRLKSVVSCVQIALAPPFLFKLFSARILKC